MCLLSYNYGQIDGPSLIVCSMLDCCLQSAPKQFLSIFDLSASSLRSGVAEDLFKLQI